MFQHYHSLANLDAENSASAPYSDDGPFFDDQSEVSLSFSMWGPGSIERERERETEREREREQSDP